MDVTYERMSGSLGSLLLVWASLERTLRSEIIRAKGCLPEGAYGAGALLRCWESVVAEKHPRGSLGELLTRTLLDQLQGPRAVRNGLCHGLVGISAADGQVPAKLFWEINGQQGSISWDESQEQFGWLSRLPRAVWMISSPSLQGSANRLADTAENREWWRSEFLINLPMP